MRSLEAIEKDLSAAREALLSVEGSPAEVYSRIVGYYRSVRNWNRGKREEYSERRHYRMKDGAGASSPPSLGTSTAGLPAGAPEGLPAPKDSTATNQPSSSALLLLFVRSSCPACSPAKTAAEKLGIPVELVNADTAEGKAEALRRKVLSTPTAILLSPDAAELGRAFNAENIGSLLKNTA